MSAISYSGGTIIDTTFSTSSRADVVTNLITQLGNAGWSVLSTTSSTDKVMQSATTADGNSICIRVYDPGSGTCARLKLRNASGTIISSIDIYLNPGTSKTWRFIGCKYNFFVLTAGSSPAREFAMAGTLALPSFLSGVTTGDLGFAWGNALSDGDTAIRDTPRTKLGYTTNQFAGLFNGTLVDMSGGTNIGSPSLIVKSAPATQVAAQQCYRWSDNTLRMHEAELAWGVSSGTTEAKSYGFIHNCLVSSDAWPVDDRTVTSYDSHAWHCITDNNTGTNGQYARGSLFVAIS